MTKVPWKTIVLELTSTQWTDVCGETTIIIITKTTTPLDRAQDDDDVFSAKLSHSEFNSQMIRTVLSFLVPNLLSLCEFFYFYSTKVNNNHVHSRESYN